MRVLVSLTVNSWDKMLKGTAVERQGGGPLSHLVLLNCLQDELLLKREKRHHSMQTVANACACIVTSDGTCGPDVQHVIHGHLEQTHTQPITPLVCSRSLLLSLGCLRSACAPDPQRDG